MSKKILLADDEKFIARAYSEGLTRAGFEVITAGNGIEALELIKKNHPDVILLDLIMPGMTGFEVLKNIEADPVLKKIPVLILSNLSQDIDQKEAMDLGAKDFIIKSEISLQDVITRVKSFLV